MGVILDWSTAAAEDFNLRKISTRRAPTLSALDKIIVSSIGQPGIGISAREALKEIEKFTGKAVNLNILEIESPDTDAQLVAENIAQQLEKRISFRRAMKQAITRAKNPGYRPGERGQRGGNRNRAPKHVSEVVSNAGLWPPGRRGYRPQRRLP